MQIVMYFLSLFLATISLIFFVTLGGFIIAYLYKQIGDSTAWENGFSSLNPLNHIDLFIILIFMTTGWFLGMKRPPFTIDFESNYQDIGKRLVYFFGPGIFHLCLASLLLFIGVSCFSVPFFPMALKTTLRASSSFIAELVTMLRIKGVKLIVAGFFLYSISMNLILALLNFIFSAIDLLLKKYFLPDMTDLKFILLFYLAIFLFLAFFSQYIMYFFWKLIVLPLYLLY